MKDKGKKKEKIKAWALFDIGKKDPRLCFAGPKGSKSHKLQMVAIFFKKPSIKKLKLRVWESSKRIKEIQIFYDI